MPITIEDETTVSVEGEDCWTVKQFSALTEKEPGTIRMLVSKGNRIRKLKTIRVAGKPFILANELFDFPFVINGRPDGFANSTCVTRFFIREDGELVSKEEQYKLAEKIVDQ